MPRTTLPLCSMTKRKFRRICGVDAIVTSAAEDYFFAGSVIVGAAGVVTSADSIRCWANGSAASM